MALATKEISTVHSGELFRYQQSIEETNGIVGLGMLMNTLTSLSFFNEGLSSSELEDLKAQIKEKAKDHLRAAIEDDDGIAPKSFLPDINEALENDLLTKRQASELTELIASLS